jgi:hypothetical protein
LGEVVLLPDAADFMAIRRPVSFHASYATKRCCLHTRNPKHRAYSVLTVMWPILNVSAVRPSTRCSGKHG